MDVENIKTYFPKEKEKNSIDDRKYENDYYKT